MQAWYVMTGIDAVGSLREEGAVLLAERRGQAINRWRHAVSDAIAGAGLHPDGAALLRALTVADKSGINHRIWSLFQSLGINHLLVISGLHIGMVAGLGLLLGRCLAACPGLPSIAARQAPAVTAAFLALLYAAAAGFSIATQRALFMLLCFILAGALGREVRPADKLLLAAALVIVGNPFAPLGSGFWLSFSAVAALLWLAHWCRPAGAHTGVPVVHGYMALLMLPLGGFWFGASSWLSAPANLLMVPLVGLYVVPMALLGVLLMALGLPGHDALWRAAGAPLSQLVDAADSLLRGAGSLSLNGTLSVAMLAAVALGLWTVPVSMRLRLLAASLWLPLLLPPKLAPSSPMLNILDVGQGTAVIFRADGRTLVYDTGGGNPSGANLAQSVVLPFLRSQGVRSVDSLCTLILKAGDSILRGCNISNLNSKIDKFEPII